MQLHAHNGQLLVRAAHAYRTASLKQNRCLLALMRGLVSLGRVWLARVDSWAWCHGGSHTVGCPASDAWCCCGEAVDRAQKLFDEMSSISQFYILSPRGDTIISKEREF